MSTELRKPSARRRTRIKRSVTVLISLLAWLVAGEVAGFDFGPDFNHDETGFSLDFRHATVRCEACHQQAIFLGTPRQCAQCHSNSGRIRASAKSSQHIPVTGDCDYCHQPSSWTTVVRVDHIAVVGSCQGCHNGVTAEGKNPGHIQSGNNCDDCHRTFAWTGAVFDHANVSGNCFSCHNGIIAEGKNPTHILSSNSCEDCHSTFTWSPVLRVDHNSVLGNCYSCHNGITAEGKHPQHISTSNDCELCHSTFAWLPATFIHQSPAYPGEHRQNLDCIDCHIANSSAVAWPNAAYQPECAGCHAGNFTPGPHKKYESPDTFYSVSELRDCSGACHLYTDSTLTVIKQLRPGEHRVSDSGF